MHTYLRTWLRREILGGLTSWGTGLSSSRRKEQQYSLEMCILNLSGSSCTLRPVFSSG